MTLPTGTPSIWTLASQRARAAGDDPSFAAAERAWDEASSSLPTFNEASAELALRRVLQELGLQRAKIGIDDAAVANALVRYGWEQDRLVDVRNLFQKLRMVKSTVEIERMRTAAQLNADSARAMFETLQPGMAYGDVQASFFAEGAKPPRSCARWESTHMESLILVREDGAEWLDEYDDPLYEVSA